MLLALFGVSSRFGDARLKTDEQGSVARTVAETAPAHPLLVAASLFSLVRACFAWMAGHSWQTSWQVVNATRAALVGYVVK